MSLIWTTLPLREKCPYLKLFWSLLSRIRTEYGVYLRIQCKCGNIRTKKTPNTNTFHAVYACWVFYFLRYINTNTSKLKRSPIGDTNGRNNASAFPIFEDCFFANGLISSHSGIFRFLTVFEKKLFRFSAFLASFIKILSLPTSFLWFCLVRKKGLFSKTIIHNLSCKISTNLLIIKRLTSQKLHSKNCSTFVRRQSLLCFS